MLKKLCEVGTQNLWEEKQKERQLRALSMVCLPLLWWFDDWLRPGSKDTSLIFDGVLVTQRSLLQRKHVSQRSFTFHLTRERSHVLTSSKPFKHQATALQGSHRFVVCELGRGGQYSCLLMESVQSNLRTPRVFYKEDVLSRNPVSGVSDQSCFKEVRDVPPDQAPVKRGSCFSSAGS